MVFLRGYEGFILLQFVYCILCHSSYILFYICCIFEMFLVFTAISFPGLSLVKVFDFKAISWLNKRNNNLVKN